jgi:hypothetical protein
MTRVLLLAKKENAVMHKVTVESLREALRAYRYEHFGLRVLRSLPVDGEVLAPSRRWQDNEPTDEKLPGTSAVSITERTISRALYDATQYPGRYIVLLGSDENMGAEQRLGL